MTRKNPTQAKKRLEWATPALVADKESTVIFATKDWGGPFKPFFGLSGVVADPGHPP
jgi:hypothetical protein